MTFINTIQTKNCFLNVNWWSNEVIFQSDSFTGSCVIHFLPEIKAALWPPCLTLTLLTIVKEMLFGNLKEPKKKGHCGKSDSITLLLHSWTICISSSSYRFCVLKFWILEPVFSSLFQKIENLKETTCVSQNLTHYPSSNLVAMSPPCDWISLLSLYRAW